MFHNEKRFFRFVDSGDNNALIFHCTSESLDDAEAQFLQATGYDVETCPRVLPLSYKLNGWAHRSFMGAKGICGGCGKEGIPADWEYCLQNECERLKASELPPAVVVIPAPPIWMG